MPLEPEVLTIDSLYPPLPPRLGDTLMIWVFSRERKEHDLIYATAHTAVRDGFILAESLHNKYQREWLLALPVEPPHMEEPATLETMLGYTDEEIEALAEKMKRTPRWLRWIFGKLCDFLEWLDRTI